MDGKNKDYVQVNVRIRPIHKRWLEAEKSRTGHSMDRVVRDVIRVWKKKYPRALEEIAHQMEEEKKHSDAEIELARALYDTILSSYREFLIEDLSWPAEMVDPFLKPATMFIDKALPGDTEGDEDDDGEEAFVL